MRCLSSFKLKLSSFEVSAPAEELPTSPEAPEAPEASETPEAPEAPEAEGAETEAEGNEVVDVEPLEPVEDELIEAPGLMVLMIRMFCILWGL